MFKGIAASPGIEIGKAYLLKKQQIVIDTGRIQQEDIDREIERFLQAVIKSKNQLAEVKERAEKNLGHNKAEIFGAHIMMLEDPVLIDEIKEKIKSDKIKAEYAVSQVVDTYIKMFKNMEDEYLKERATDIKDVGERIIKNILGIPIRNLVDISDEIIIVSKDLTPSDTAQMNKNKVKAFATDIGSRTSHTAIMARSLEIPAVVGLGNISREIKDGDTIIVDGNKGVVFINPDEAVLKEYENLKEEYNRYRLELKELKNLPAETKDRARRVELAANIGTPGDIKGALENGAEGIGLYRTEFLYMDRESLPTEEEQFEAYKAVAEAMAPRSVIIRTLDIGGDKKLPYLKMPDELNPFLGWRAIRMCLDRPQILKTQLRAILRASFYGNLRIMYPMVSRVEEIRRANSILKEVKQELKIEGLPYDENIQVGIMVEIPSVAIIADILAKEVDFFSIGTNDLIQYTLAIDRTNENISHLYETLHPAVLRLIKNVIDASHSVGKWTGMCGEMAGDITAVPILLGMGLDEFSMSAVSIPQVKKVVRSLTFEEAKQFAKKVLNTEEPAEIRKMVEELLEKIKTVDIHIDTIKR